MKGLSIDLEHNKTWFLWRLVLFAEDDSISVNIGQMVAKTQLLSQAFLHVMVMKG